MKWFIFLLIAVVVILAAFFILKNRTPAPAGNDMITVDTPQADSVVSSPVVIRGQARGNWYFEAVFPIRIYDANGKELGSVQGQAKSDWMTQDFVPFEAILTFDKPTTPTGTLVLEKDNPSGLPQNAGSLTIPVRFSQ